MSTTTGTVKWFNESKGFGFIESKNLVQTFLLISALSPVQGSKLWLKVRKLNLLLLKALKVLKQKTS